jgi:hypothetical protein
VRVEACRWRTPEVGADDAKPSRTVRCIRTVGRSESSAAPRPGKGAGGRIACRDSRPA